VKFSKSSAISDQFLRNALVSGLSFVIDFGVFSILLSHTSRTPALIGGYFAGLIINYILSSIWVFDERAYRTRRGEVGAFFVAGMSGLVVDLAVFSIAATVVPPGIARLFSIGTAFGWNFALKELVVFRTTRSVRLNDIIGSYSRLSISQRIYITLRYWTCPIERVMELATGSTLLDLGAGSGVAIVAARLLHPKLQATALEPDPRKQMIIKQLTSNTDIIDRLSGSYDTITIIDVLYLFSEKDREQLLLDCIRHLNSGGKLIIKEMSAFPRYKFLWNQFQESISVHITKMTYSEHPPSVWTVEAIAKFAESHKLTATITNLDRKFLHPHALVVISPTNFTTSA
jgi:putative flippase GtrA